ncbi:hypothetical protein ACQKMD_11275 [Viridibacillus sp. NPDC096237]|uniref:hypothetical protein n=1 Tax=Viridibacillus sp. NPDC096237 TaxID=3390721 RepID=UPI003CFFAB46
MSSIQSYERINFLDHILRIDEKGNFIPLIDPSTGQQKVNLITGQKEWEALQEGTRLKALTMNYLDKNIETNRNYISDLHTLVRRLQLQLEMDGRAPGSSGTFFDTLDGFSNKIYLQSQQTSINKAITAGATTIPVDNIEGFTAFTQVTIYDDEHSEDGLITAINGNSITVQALTNAYKKGAKVARSTVAVDTVNKKMDIGNWETFSVSILEVV